MENPFSAAVIVSIVADIADDVRIKYFSLTLLFMERL